MLKQLLWVAVFATLCCNAQNVVIPDAAFKAQLLAASTSNENCYAKNNLGQCMVIDTNSDGEIQVSEALAVSELYVGNEGISSLQGLEAFTNVTKLGVGNSNLINLDVTMLPLLEEFGAGGNPLIENINFSGLTPLHRIDLADNAALSTFNLEGVTNLIYLYCSGSGNITSIDVSDCIHLQRFECEDNLLTSLDCSANTELISLSCDGNALTSLTCSNLPNLVNLTCSSNNLTSLDLHGLPQLYELEVSGNQLNALDLSQVPLLGRLTCIYNELTQLDVSNNPNLEWAYAQYNQITYANLKNGSYYWQLNLSNNPLAMVCVDVNENGNLAFSILGPSVVRSSFCSFEPGGNFNTITGTVKYDSAANGCGPEDNGMVYAKVSLTDGDTTVNYFTGAGGNYTAYAGTGSYTLACDTEDGWFNVASGPQQLNFSTTGQTVNKPFCVSSTSMTEDNEVFFVPLSSAQPGFDAVYQLGYRNNGSVQSASGTITLTYDDEILDFVAAVPPPASDVNGVLTWNYASLQEFETRTVQLIFNLNSPAETPAVNLDDVLDYNVGITSSGSDGEPNNNSFNFVQVVTGSFDPNDMTCLEGGAVSDELIGSYLHYNINFENTGTAPATFIVVEDQFNEGQFDMASFELLSASHPVKVKVVGQAATFRFDNINLGPNEKGNVVFKIASSADLATGDSVSNKANIFFDYNLPIETNTATTTFQVLGAQDFSAENVRLYPNPTTGVINIEAASAIEKVELYDIQGRQLQLHQGASEKLDLSDRAKGIYFIKVSTVKGVKTEKIVLD